MTDEIAEKIKGKTCCFQDCGKPAVAVVVEKGDCVWMLVCGDHAAMFMPVGIGIAKPKKKSEERT